MSTVGAVGCNSTSRASGRTSFPVDKLPRSRCLPRLGYHQCGERAVRVDILERLADLIRPRYRGAKASPAPSLPARSTAAVRGDRRRMTSLTGSAGEDFASILRALGYRMERRPAPPPKPVVVETVAAEPRSG